LTATQQHLDLHNITFSPGNLACLVFLSLQPAVHTERHFCGQPSHFMCCPRSDFSLFDITSARHRTAGLHVHTWTSVFTCTNPLNAYENMKSWSFVLYAR